MEDDTSTIIEKAQELGDVELAILLCLISNEHCIIEADAEDIQTAEKELQSLCSNTFGLKSAIIECSKNTTIDAFGEGILVDDGGHNLTPETWRHEPQKDSLFASEEAEQRRLAHALENTDARKVADVIIARDLHLACVPVQVQALELMRGGRIYTRKSMYMTPKKFLLIALNTTDHSPTMVVHLNDHFHISHFFQPNDKDMGGMYQHRNGSSGSVVRSRPVTPGILRSTSYRSYIKPIILHTDIEALAYLASKVKLHPDIRAYMHNIVVFLRMHRAIASGVSPHATRHLYSLVNALAPLHGLDFITPSLVALAVRKVYPHRLEIVEPEDEISLQWGSQVEAVREYLDGVTSEDVIEDVLNNVETPL